jgi:predicted  nucleic acid-binding Zn-ribbon protein
MRIRKKTKKKIRVKKRKKPTVMVIPMHPKDRALGIAARERATGPKLRAECADCGENRIIQFSNNIESEKVKDWCTDCAPPHQKRWLKTAVKTININRGKRMVARKRGEDAKKRERKAWKDWEREVRKQERQWRGKERKKWEGIRRRMKGEEKKTIRIKKTKKRTIRIKRKGH